MDAQLDKMFKFKKRINPDTVFDEYEQPITSKILQCVKFID